jgi:hypothetical protein
MILGHDGKLSPRNFCLCCVGATAFAASGGSDARAFPLLLDLPRLLDGFELRRCAGM